MLKLVTSLVVVLGLAGCSKSSNEKPAGATSGKVVVDAGATSAPKTTAVMLGYHLDMPLKQALAVVRKAGMKLVTTPAPQWSDGTIHASGKLFGETGSVALTFVKSKLVTLDARMNLGGKKDPMLQSAFYKDVARSIGFKTKCSSPPGYCRWERVGLRADLTESWVQAKDAPAAEHMYRLYAYKWKPRKPLTPEQQRKRLEQDKREFRVRVAAAQKLAAQKAGQWKLDASRSTCLMLLFDKRPTTAAKLSDCVQAAKNAKQLSSCLTSCERLLKQ